MRTSHSYFVYILTNTSRKVLYTGITNNLSRRLKEHRKNALEAKSSFAGLYNCFYLVYWEHFHYVDQAIAREKEIKGWRRAKKEGLIKSFNPQWKFLNSEIGCPLD